ncbi:MAG: prephenate dehydratase [Desulfomonilaceae bacterium]
MTKKTLEELRARIDQLDSDLIDLLNRRMSLCQEIGHFKSAAARNVVDREREAEILRRLASENPGPLSEQALSAVFREIFSGSRALQAPVTIAFLGPAGTYTHEAAIEMFGHSATFIPCLTVRDVFEEVVHGGVTYAVAPIENSIEGSVRETLDLLMTSSIGVCREVSLRVSHALMNLTGKIEDIQQVISHPQALAQCRRWLADKLPGIPLRDTSSTARAAELAMESVGTAAIASERIGTRLGLQIIRRGIQDSPENITRFFALGSLKSAPTGDDKTSIVFWTEDKPGALHKILKKFAQHGINLSRIESRPDRGAVAWKYAFFVDLEGHRDDPEVAACLKEITGKRTMVKVLGSFPSRSLPAGE